MTNSHELLTPLQGLWIGGLTGAAQVTINLPFWTLKTRMQCGLDFSLNLKILYRGYLMSLSSVSTVTATQVLNSVLVERSINENNRSNDYKRIFSAFLGGMASSLLFGPLDLITTQHHKNNYKSNLHSISETFKKIGLGGFTIGLPATFMLDGIFTGAFFGVYPYLKKKMQAYSNNSFVVIGATGLITGVITSLITHQLDIIKTKQQNDADVAKKTMRECFNELYEKNNRMVFFKGFVPRSIFLTSTIAIMGMTANILESSVKKTGFTK